MVEIWFSILVCKAMEKSIAHFLFWGNPPQKVGKFMSEALICRRGYKDSSTPSIETGNLITTTITSNQQWVVPNHVGNISVRIFGGGGAGYGDYRVNNVSFAGGGGGGMMNNADIDLANGASVQITIGAGGISTAIAQQGTSGGTSSFGSYLSANGGEAATTLQGGNGGAGGGCTATGFGTFNTRPIAHGGDGYQFGGGGGDQFTYGGNGGPWGGGGGSMLKGGAGGMWGGGGGSANEAVAVGGTYGGNGAWWNGNVVSENGINTMANQSVPNDCRGPGLAGSYSNLTKRRCTGGGGYGGSGGNADCRWSSDCATGGGGYGGNGGYTISRSQGTGGGGYGHGADGGSDSGGGGGGYFASGGTYAGGGGSYGRGGGLVIVNNSTYPGTVYTNAIAPTFGGGGCGQWMRLTDFGTSIPYHNGASGICIIQYYEPKS